MRVIAHRITSASDANTAFNVGADFVEIDVAERFFPSKFHLQHDAIKGKLGIGKKLTPILRADFRKKLFLDIKHANYSFSFAKNFIGLLKKLSVDGSSICGYEWSIISKIATECKLKTFYSIEKNSHIEKLRKKINSLKKPSGVSVRYTLINKDTLKSLRQFLPETAQIWVWTVNDVKAFDQLIKLGVDGIITDNWEKLISTRN